MLFQKKKWEHISEEQRTQLAVLQLLRKSGPLNAAQISVDLILDYTVVRIALEGLAHKGEIVPRPDRKREPVSDPEIPWGLIGPFDRPCRP